MINRTEQEVMRNWKLGSSKPLISICTITYNHKKYIAEALDSFLMQETDFPFEIVVDDDCSPDGTVEVIRKYMKKFPNIIKTNLRKENVGAMTNFIENINRAKGKYIALCEGDDYWIDPNKLQIQVDFLEANQDYVISGHDAFIVDENGKHLQDSKLPDSQKKDFEAEDLILGKVWILTMSWVFRNVLPETFPSELHKVLNGDAFMLTWLGLYGKSKYHSEIKPACYRAHPGGIWSMLPEKEKEDAHLNTYYWMYRYYDRIGEEKYAQAHLLRHNKLSLSQNMDTPKSKYLVFTSAGDNSNLLGWLKGNRDFDLWVSYYDNEPDRYRDISDYYMVKKGGKFPALHYAYQHWKKILDQYQAILVMDDDIIIDAPAISDLFKIREKYDLWLLQSAFDPKGKVSHPITQVNPATFMRYTNFVEVTCPLFLKNKLDEFMRVYDPVLVGWGVDWWYMDVLASDIEGKVAVIDEISCINPLDNTKGGQREIDLLQKTPDRIKQWKKIKEKYNIGSEDKGFMEYGSIVPNEAIFEQVIQPKNKEINSLKDKVKLQDKAIQDLRREQEQTNNHLHAIFGKIYQLVSASGKTEPIKKYKAYKEMMTTYIKIKGLQNKGQ